MGDEILVSLPSRDNEFQTLQAEDAQETASRLGLEVRIEYADGSALQQIQQLFKHIHGGDPPQAIVAEPVAFEGVRRVAQKATATGVGWCILNCTADYIEPLRQQYPEIPIFAVGSDQTQIGRLQGRQIRALLPSGGTVLYVQGPPASVAAQERLRGAEEELSAAGIDPTILDADWSEDSAEQAVRSWLRLKINARMDLVACQDDAMARGASRAVQDLAGSAWDGVPFLGIDGVPSVGQKLVSEGMLTATVIQPSNTGPALEALAEWKKSGTSPPAWLKLPVESFPLLSELRPRSG